MTAWRRRKAAGGWRVTAGGWCVTARGGIPTALCHDQSSLKNSQPTRPLTASSRPEEALAYKPPNFCGKAMSGEHEVTTWYLEMPARSALVPARTPAWEHRLERASRPSAAFARYLYTAVGGDWHWTCRLAWSKARWDALLLRDAYELYTLQLAGAPAGFAELERQRDGNVQIVYFGLMPEAVGRGFGGRLLSYVVERAWEPPNTRRVWVHTCSLDAPAALANYQGRGFTLFRTETKPVTLAGAPGPWPGWNRDGG